jgi:Methyltransferase domain
VGEGGKSTPLMSMGFDRKQKPTQIPNERRTEMSLVERVFHHFHHPTHQPFTEFMDFKVTLQTAKRKNLTVGDYIDNPRRVDGLTPTEWTLKAMKEAGVFANPLQKICEIGPGSGRYLIKTHDEAPTAAAEIYETSAKWRAWLVANNPWITAKQCDGRTLSKTSSGTVDLVQAHRVFPGLSCLNLFSYWNEMIRVLRPGGYAVFDILSEAAFSNANLNAFERERAWTWSWEPHIMPRGFALQFFTERRMTVKGAVFIRSAEVGALYSLSELFVFQKS